MNLLGADYYRIICKLVVFPSYGLILSPLLSMDNLHIKDKIPAPNVSVIREVVYCNVTESQLTILSHHAI